MVVISLCDKWPDRKSMALSLATAFKPAAGTTRRRCWRLHSRAAPPTTKMQNGTRNKSSLSENVDAAARVREGRKVKRTNSEGKPRRRGKYAGYSNT